MKYRTDMQGIHTNLQGVQEICDMGCLQEKEMGRLVWEQKGVFLFCNF